VVELTPYYKDDHPTRLRADSLQQVEDNEGPSIEYNSGYQASQGSLRSSGNAQDLIQAFRRQSLDLPGFEAMYKPYSIHLISYASIGLIAISFT